MFGFVYCRFFGDFCVVIYRLGFLIWIMFVFFLEC